MLESKITTVQEKELKLRNTISQLMKMEEELEKQKINSKDSLADLKKRIEKIIAIKNDLKEV